MATAKKATGAAEAFETMTAFSPETFKEGYEKLAEGFSSFAEFQKGSMEAFMASAGAWTKGVEKLASEQSAFAKAAFEDTVANAKATAASKSIQDSFDLNSNFVRTTIEKNLGQANKVADLMIETAKDTVEPLSSHYGEVVEKIQTYRP